MSKRTYIVIFLIVLVAGATYSIRHWDDLFVNVAEPAYTASAAPEHVVMTMGAYSHDRAFSWRTADTLPSFLVLDADTFPASGTMIASRSGEAAYYSVYTPSLSEGPHTYFIQSGDYRTPDYSFTIGSDSITQILLLGDIENSDTTSAHFHSLQTILHHYPSSSLSFVGYVGDILKYPTDECWQSWFTMMDTLSAIVPQVAAVGENEYLKGLVPTLDNRFTSIFSNPQNGPTRFLGTSYFIDYPHLRYVVINTEGLLRLSDYTITNTWLTKVLQEAGDKWKIVVMHKPVYSAAMQDENPMIFTFFHRSLRDADVVFAGDNHNYARRYSESILSRSRSIAYVTTSSTDDYYMPKCDDHDDRIGSNRAFYEQVVATPDSLWVTTYLFPEKVLCEDSVERMISPIYDQFTIARDTRIFTQSNNLSNEILELPEEYKKTNRIAVHRSINRMNTRREETK